MSGRLFAGTLLAFLLAGCASGATSTAAPSGVMASPTAEASLAPSSTPAARVYPYTLPWPAEELEAEWRYAVTPWDGAARIDHGNKYTDSVRTEDGDLFAFGYETSKSAVELQAMVAEQASKWHGCDEQPTEESTLAGGGEVGISAVHDCGGRHVLRWFAVHDGFGLVVALIVASDAGLDVARSHFADRIGDLVWNR